MTSLGLFLGLLAGPGHWAAGTEGAPPMIQEQKARPVFTIEDALALETFGYYYGPPIVLSGDLLAFAVVDRYYEKRNEDSLFYFVPEGSHVFIQDFLKHNRVPITNASEYSWSPVWSPDGRNLAFFVWHDSTIKMGIWNRVKGESRYFEIKRTLGRGLITWHPKGNVVFYSANDHPWKGPIRPYGPDEDPIVRNTADEVNAYDGRLIERGREQIVGLEIDTGRNFDVTPRPMSIGYNSLRLSPDGRNLSLLVKTRNKMNVAMVPVVGDFVVYDLENGDSETILSNADMGPYAWSPTSREVAYLKDGKLWLYSLDDHQNRPLGQGDARFSGPPLWHPDGRRILCLAGEDLRLLDTVTAVSEELSIGIPATVGTYQWDDEGKSAYLQVLSPENGRQGIYRYSLKKKRAEKILSGDWMIGNLLLGRRHILFTLQTAVMPENIWVLDSQGGRMEQVTDLNRSAERFSFGRSELVSWKSRGGNELKGVLLYPAGYVPGQKYPLVCEVYSTFSSLLHRFFLHLYNLQILTNQGYAVLLPDIQFGKEGLVRSYLDCLEPALDRLEELGLSNGSCGVMGHSFGGYGTNVLATHSRRFKAAIALAGMSDYLSYHGSLPSDYGREYTRATNEMGQGELGDDFSAAITRYLENSPVCHLDRLQTPLLLIHGTDDWTVPFSQAEEMYFGLRYLNKKAVLIGYPGEDHLWTGTAKRHFVDMWQRIIAWFDEHLK